MGIFDSIKNIMTIPEEDGYEEEYTETEEDNSKKKVTEEETYTKKENTPKIFQNNNFSLRFTAIISTFSGIY